MALNQQLDELLEGMMPIVHSFHCKGMYAPHAATIDYNGEVKGKALTMDGSSSISVDETITYFEDTFSELAHSKEITASGIFYHSIGMTQENGVFKLPPAEYEDECNVLVGLLEHFCGDSVYLIIPHDRNVPDVEYGSGKLVTKPPKVFVSSAKKPWWKFW